MISYYIIPPSVYAQTDWQASACCHVGPVAIINGPHAGNYAVNTALFDSDTSFESYRSLLEQYPQATLTADELTSTQDNE